MNIVEALANKVASIVTTNAMLIRTFILVLFISLLTLGFMEYIRRVWREDFELKMPGGNGAIAFRFSDGDFRNVIFLVPASKCWVNTGLEFKPGDRIRFRTSGQVHLAQNLIRQEEISDVKWSNPQGSGFVELTKGINRSDFLISKHRNDKNEPLVGNLVGFLRVDGLDGDSPGPSNPRPVGKNGNKVFHIGEDYEITNETGHNAYLWLTVNDLVLNDSDLAKAAYVGDSLEFMKKELAYPPLNSLDKAIRTTSAITKWQMHRDYWNTIQQKGEWDIFFQDNIGTYLVFIERQSKRGF